MMYILIAICVLISLIALWLIFGYNQLIRLHAVVQEAWSGIEVQLKRRYDVIPRLLDTVKQYGIHEQQVLERVTNMRSQSMQSDDVAHKSTAESGLTNALKSLFAVAENYPNLKANENYIQLQHEIAKIEDDIHLARRYYNGAVRNYNIVVRSFPSHLIATLFGYTTEPYFTIERDEEREAPHISSQ